MNGEDYIKTLEIEISPLGCDVANLLSTLLGGMHHLTSHTKIVKIDWSNPYYIVVPFGRGLATYDGNLLTSLVVLAHDNLLRVEVNPRHRLYLELVFHKRKGREGWLSERMPTIEEHIKLIRK